LKEFLFSEGSGLQHYVNLFLNSVEIVLGKLRDEGWDRKKIIAVYIGLQSLEWDNQFIAHSHTEDGILPSLYGQSIRVVQSRILRTWPFDAPTLFPFLDTWIKRKRNDHHILAQREDRVSFFKWNLAILEICKTNYVNPMDSEIIGAVDRLIDHHLNDLDTLPTTHYTTLLWNHIYQNVPQNEAFIVRNFIHASLIFQKLRMEDDYLGFLKADPFLDSKFVNIQHYFSEGFQRSATLQMIQRDFQHLSYQIFNTWQHDLPLLHGNREQWTLCIKNERILKRLVPKINKVLFPELLTAIMETTVALEQRAGHLRPGEILAELPPFLSDEQHLLVELNQRVVNLQ